MKFLNRNKHSLIGVGFILLFFFISMLVRKENLSAPIIRNHEWITAHTLITAEIWNENGGPSNYGFSPVYTKPGTGNEYRRSLGGITNSNGETYYVSYPPFSFLFFYYSSQVFGGPNPLSIRIIALLIHLASSLLIYFLIGALISKNETSYYNFAGIIAAGFYIFAEGNLWFLGNIYFADTLVQLFFILGLLLTIRYFKGNYKKKWVLLSLIGLTFFCASYTEWLGLFSAFFSGTCFLIIGLIRKNKALIHAFFVIGFSASLALGITLFQYATIDGWESLKQVSEKKYAERSGYNDELGSAQTYNIHNAEAYDFMEFNFGQNYKTIQNALLIIVILFVLILVWRKSRQALGIPNWQLLTLVLTLLPIIIHYILFFNFNVVHPFSAIKTAFLLILLIAILIQQIEISTLKTNRFVFYGSLTIVTVLFSFKAKEGVERYLHYNPIQQKDLNLVYSSLQVSKNADPNSAVFINEELTPQYIFYAKHSVDKTDDPATMLDIMDYRKNDNAQYYYHENHVVKYMINLTVQNDKLVFLDTIYFE